MADPQTLVALAEQVRVPCQALEHVATDPRLQRLIVGSFSNFATIDRAIELRDWTSQIGVLGELRSSELLLWMKLR